MTRINVIPVSELSDQHLVAEYRELPRVLKQHFNTENAPSNYCLGKGHVKWAKMHEKFIACRYLDLCREMHFRGFKTSYTTPFDVLSFSNNYNPTQQDIILNQKRIKEKYDMKPDWYRWTKRTKPKWII